MIRLSLFAICIIPSQSISTITVFLKVLSHKICFSQWGEIIEKVSSRAPAQP